ncbi:MAG: VOC family protein [Oligoflexales bacterium]
MTAFSHISLNVSNLEISRKFYLEVLAPLGFSIADSSANEYVRFTNGSSLVIVLCSVEEKHRQYAYHRKAIGLGHFAISVPSKEIVDATEASLRKGGVQILGDGKVEIGYRKGYYCFLFEDPDRVMIEIVYHDPFYFSREPP